MKCCIKCSIEKDDIDFRKNRNQCKKCENEYCKQHYHTNKKERYQKQLEWCKKNRDKRRAQSRREYKKNCHKHMLYRAKVRSEQKNLPFDIEIEDIIIPTVCPILGIPLEPADGKSSQPNSPSLDRIVPEKGYVKGNIIVISNKANTMKSYATPEEMIKLGEFAKKLLEETENNDRTTINNSTGN